MGEHFPNACCHVSSDASRSTAAWLHPPAPAAVGSNATRPIAALSTAACVHGQSASGAESAPLASCALPSKALKPPRLRCELSVCVQSSRTAMSAYRPSARTSCRGRISSFGENPLTRNSPGGRLPRANDASFRFIWASLCGRQSAASDALSRVMRLAPQLRAAFGRFRASGCGSCWVIEFEAVPPACAPPVGRAWRGGEPSSNSLSLASAGGGARPVRCRARNPGGAHSLGRD